MDVGMVIEKAAIFAAFCNSAQRARSESNAVIAIENTVAGVDIIALFGTFPPKPTFAHTVPTRGSASATVVSSTS